MTDHLHLFDNLYLIEIRQFVAEYSITSHLLCETKTDLTSMSTNDVKQELVGSMLGDENWQWLMHGPKCIINGRLGTDVTFDVALVTSVPEEHKVFIWDLGFPLVQL
ncbi:hypothetical protein [Acinetobacter sp. CAAS 2-6]|uniref:hypothetical protein n=1 Tax=Acinetobacter sp. CAAS 2-6 TaxID=3016358 RepID=UPI002DD6B2D7|nr:hypothetical protein [Acinetobacter sp. CAAS 2-6]